MCVSSYFFLSKISLFMHVIWEKGGGEGWRSNNEPRGVVQIRIVYDERNKV
jgi:hypothetical protein